MSGWWLASYLVLWLLTGATLLVLLVVLRQLGLIYARIQHGGLQLDEGPAVGSVIAPFTEREDGTEREVAFPRPETLNLLLFTSPHCAICADALRGLQTALRGRHASALVVSEGEAEENGELHGLVGPPARFVTSLKRQRAFGIETIPYGIVVDGKGVVLDKGVVNGLGDLEDMLDNAEARSRQTADLVPA
jgi:methylamine dehydrogenase accessory protein MauD